MKQHFTFPTFIGCLATRILLMTAMLTLLTAGALADTKAAKKQKPTPSNSAVLQNLDTSVSPCKDFYQYANGGWLKEHPISRHSEGDDQAWSVADILAKENLGKLRDILEKAKEHPKSDPEEKLGDYFASCTAEEAIEKEGLALMQPEFARISAIENVGEVQREIGRLHSMGFPVLFEIGAELDRRNGEEVIPSAAQGGLGLPERDHYLKDDIRSQDIRDMYTAYVAKLLNLAGDPVDKAAAEAVSIVSLEKKLANSSLTRIERGDVGGTYHRVSLTEASQITPTFDWSQYFKALEISSTAINVTAPGFFKELDKELTATPIDDWKAYLRFHLINMLAPSLSSPFADASFDFFGGVLRGKTNQLLRWQRCVSETEDALGDSLEQVYGEQTLPPGARTAVVNLARDIVAALRKSIKSASWMDETTKKRALEKLAALKVEIGYPKEWRDDEDLTINRDSYLGNILSARAFASQQEIGKIGHPPHSSEWGISAAAVNAFYNPTLNQIVFPAGFLQPPFFDAKRDDAYNYGAVGSLIAHELMHGFDEEGSMFDAKGNPNDWWTPDGRKRFQKEIAACIEKQFRDDVFAVADTHTNVKLIPRESIADLAGLELAFQGYVKSHPDYEEQHKKDGFTAAQRFFIGYAQSWASNAPIAADRLQATTDPHPLDKFRVKATLSNMPAFADAFNCAPTAKMVRAAEDSCPIW